MPYLTNICGALLSLWVCVAANVASAHDFWVAPSNFEPRTGERVNIGLCIGDPFVGWSMARNAQRIEQFTAVGARGEQAIVGIDGIDPAGVTRFTAPGVYVIGYRSNPAFTELPASKFADYLTEKGLDKIIALRRSGGATGGVVREAYSRYAKSLLRVAAAGADSVEATGDRALGFRLEIVADDRGPAARRASEYSFRLLFEGKPLSGALVKAVRRAAPEQKFEVRTDPAGRAKFTLTTPDDWLIAAVHMVEASTGLAADWESLWASLTYQVPGGSARKSTTICDARNPPLTATTRP
jgi:uncharacterized GH25 family protein